MLQTYLAMLLNALGDFFFFLQGKILRQLSVLNIVLNIWNCSISVAAAIKELRSQVLAFMASMVRHYTMVAVAQQCGG